ncbi:hypothetical protein [Hoyosella altamirensis]|uniref:Bacterial Pleckstrin homology domain-containing protein n=1 Tax=Hoyosella altamirensis TaxID=616997 RepID=A0A839RJT5_9ACTN|nr:hypothetical protein [Hoyosella altamirensis]MBB3036261.1 hypothetical protein [Hoyosella altamirensis]
MSATSLRHFHEVQRFPLWIISIPLLTVAGLGALIVAFVAGGEFAGALFCGVLLAAVFLPLAVLHLRMRLVTSVDSTGLHLRIHPVRFSLLPRRMTFKDVSLDEISRWEVSVYNSLKSREFWGWHVWGLSAAKGGRYLYVMRPGLVRAQGVRVELTRGETLFIGSANPTKLAAAIARAIKKRGPA